MVQVLDDYYQPEENLFSAPIIRKGRVHKAVRKSRVNVNPERLQQAAQHHMDAFAERSEDSDQDELMDEIEDIHAPVKAQALVPVVPTRILHNSERPQPLTTALLPPIRKTKTGKVQELVQFKMPSRGDPIRGMESKPRFEINKILDTSIVSKIGEFLDCSDVAIKELAYSMQRSTPRYRVKKSPIHKAGQQMTAHVAVYPPPIASTGFDDDKHSQPLVVTSWAQGLQMEKTLLDGGPMAKLTNQEPVSKMTPRPPIYRDSRVKISLANDATTTLSKFIKIPVNVQGVETVIRPWLVDVKVYDLLLGVSWMRRVDCTQFYGEGRITIMGQDLTLREVPTPVMPLSMFIPEFEPAGLG
ncbi:hypothetical protein MMC31_008088 [Peltigera leucophlebia]|nr:hypothetical protein [Peltigera leucophlebia]